MKRYVRTALLGPLALFGFFTVVHAATPTEKPATLGNSYYIYTKALHVDDSGVVAIPARFRWSVETSSRGIDLQGNHLPDSRVMLRLYDPNHNFTALTAQMDMSTAAKLHHELGQIIVKKLQDANFQHRPKLYSPEMIPTKRILGVDENGVAIMDDVTDSKQSVPAREKK